eukprot:13172451-Alexandrium_andersonii.AAC.1
MPPSFPLPRRSPSARLLTLLRPLRGGSAEYVQALAPSVRLWRRCLVWLRAHSRGAGRRLGWLLKPVCALGALG